MELLSSRIFLCALLRVIDTNAGDVCQEFPCMLAYASEFFGLVRSILMMKFNSYGLYTDLLQNFNT